MPEVSHARLIARKNCLTIASKILGVTNFVAEPIKGLQEPEVNYYTFTAVNVVDAVNEIKIPLEVSALILPVLWNYLDAACGVSVGVSQLLDEDNYRQDQLKIKGILNIMSGVQLFVLSYNPLLIAALGVTGAPALLAGSSFALATAIDLITASIDFCNASKERHINGWMEEKCQEYRFMQKQIVELEAENELLDRPEDQSWKDMNEKKIKGLLAKTEQLKQDLMARYQIGKDHIDSNKTKALRETIGDNFGQLIAELDPVKSSERNAVIQKELNKTYEQARNTLLIKAASFIGMSLLAVGTFALFVTCPPTVPALGLAITVVVAGLYLYRHREAIAEKFSIFKHKISQQAPEPEVSNDEPSKTTIGTQGSS